MAIRENGSLAVATIPAAQAGDPYVRVFTLLAALRRRWRAWLSTALLGLMLGGLFLLSRPPEWSATTTVLLRRPTTSAADPTRQMETDVQMARSTPILNGALRHVRRGSVSGYTVSALTNDVLQIKIQAPTSSDAAQGANALANSFLSFRAQQLAEEAQVVSTVLEKETGPLLDKLAALNRQIQSTTDGGQNGLGELLASRSQLNGQLAAIQQRSSDATVSASVAAQTSRILDPASPARPSQIVTIGLDLIAGFIGGSAVGAGWVVLGAATTERVRRREEVMVALEAPVAVSVEPVVDRHRFRGRSVGINLKRLRRQHSKPGRDVTVMVQHLRRALADCDTTPSGLLVVSIDSDWSAAPLVAAAAAGLRVEGNSILMVDATKEGALARLLKVKGPTAAVNAGPPTSTLCKISNSFDFKANPDEGLPLENLDTKADIVLVLATLDPAVGAGHLAGLARTAVVVVTAGRSTATALRSTGQMIRAEGIRLHSTILVGADRKDETCGLPQSDTVSVRGPLTLQKN